MDIKHQDVESFDFRPNFGATAEFSANLSTFKYGNNYSQRIPRGINALSMKLNLEFSQLTDEEIKRAVSFLQKQFHYEAQDYSNLGYFKNKRIIPFDYQPFYPYKQNKFHCLTFTHTKSDFNINNLSANFEASVPSVIDSVESVAGGNRNIDGFLSITSPNSLASASSDNDVRLNEGDVIFTRDAYANAYVTQNFFAGEGQSRNLSYYNPLSMASGTVVVNRSEFRHSIFIDEPNDCSYYPHKPIHKDEILNFRMFDFRPSQSLTLSHTPKFRSSSASDVYKKYNKYGMNPNLFNLNVTFENRSNIEAKRILLFLESHLGYKKFGFHLQKDYHNEAGDIILSPNRQTFSTFYCPTWSHTIQYNNNHTISATFLECAR